ncbi:MAG: acetate kinase [Candidatus Bostrichicola ureolyticus]|nr:MAG: acetate kinase [Candidatus Bostrichicola ureolyticus]
MKILIINSGSSSIKYQLISMPEKFVLSKGLIERIGTPSSKMTFQHFNNVKKNINLFINNHKTGIEKIDLLLSDPNTGIIDSRNEISAIGHRVVHGGESLIETTLITEYVKKLIKSLFNIAPLHNPANYIGIEVAEKIFPNIQQVAVFDTAFHHSLPKKSYRYAIPDLFYYKYKIRSYGFHGISHKYVSQCAIKYLKKSKKLIILHLGNGASATAVENGISVETSMGFGPNSGLIMGTRVGDIDSTVIFYALKYNYTPDELSEILNKKSGMLSISGYSDMRDIKLAYDKGNSKARLAYEMYAHKVKKYIGSFISIMNGLDAIIFTGGIGENDELIRYLICYKMEFLGIYLDNKKNNRIKHIQKIEEIQKNDAKIKILVIPTNEELQISLEVYNLLKKL